MKKGKGWEGEGKKEISKPLTLGLNKNGITRS